MYKIEIKMTGFKIKLPENIGLSINALPENKYPPVIA